MAVAVGLSLAVLMTGSATAATRAADSVVRLHWHRVPTDAFDFADGQYLFQGVVQGVGVPGRLYDGQTDTTSTLALPPAGDCQTTAMGSGLLVDECDAYTAYEKANSEASGWIYTIATHRWHDVPDLGTYGNETVGAIGTQWAEFDYSNAPSPGGGVDYVNWHTGKSVDGGEAGFNHVNFDSPTFSQKLSCRRLDPSAFVSWQTPQLALMNGPDTLYVEDCASGRSTVIGSGIRSPIGEGRWVIWPGSHAYGGFDLRRGRRFRVAAAPDPSDDLEFVVGNRLYVSGIENYWAALPPTL